MEVITTHINADFDALASMLAAKKLYPNAILAFPGSQEKNIRDFLLQSTVYLFEIYRTAKIDISKIKRLILVDIRQAGRIGKFGTICRNPDVDVHIYDHHPESPDDITGSKEIIKPYGSTTTIMCELIKRKGLEISADEATVMMLGIYEDTGSLTFSSTTINDFAAASFLLSRGANLNVVSDMIVRELTAEQIVILNELVENSQIKTINGIDIMISRASSDTYVGDFAVLVHKFKNMGNINVLFAIANMDDCIYVVGRSRINEVNVGHILLPFGGGGHATAASAAVRNLTVSQVEQELIRLLEENIRPVKTARDFMTSPVKTVDGDNCLEKASSLLTRYNINVLPVIDNNEMTGLISRQIIEKAKHHGLKKNSVREYMGTEFVSVKPSTGLREIKRLIIENNQRFLPVVNNNNLMGAITRTDLLRIFHLDASESEFAQETREGIPLSKKMKHMLTERLPVNIQLLLKNAGVFASKMGCNAFAVGGFVRDIYLRVSNYDIDIVIEGDGIEFAKKFAAENCCRIKTYRKFGTAVVCFSDGMKVDVASARLEYYDKPAALPKVEWSSLKLDLYRRDFTINTLAIRLNPEHFGELIDFFGARRDIKDKTIRVLHNLSFVEDPSRIFRAIRFEQRFGLHLSKLTKNLVNNAVKMEFLADLSGKRIFTELVLLLKEENILSIIKRLSEFDLLKFVHPAVAYNKSLNVFLKDVLEVISWYNLLYLDNKCEKWFILLLVLLDKLKVSEIDGFIKHCDINKKYADSIKLAKTRGYDVLYKLSSGTPPQNSEIYRLLHGIPVEVNLFLMAKTRRQNTKKAFSIYFTQLHYATIHLTGKDLIRLGIPTGEIYKYILDELLNAVINGTVKTREDEIRFVKKKFLPELKD